MEREKILIVDNSGNRGQYHQALSSAGYHTIEASGHVSIEDLRAQHSIPALILVVMPLDIPQQDLIHSLRETDRRPFSIFILNSPAHAAQALQIGADDLLQQPFTSHDLVARVNLLAERRRRENIGRPEEASTGNLDDLSIRELIELFALGGGTATVQIQSNAHRGKMFFRDGRLFGALLNHHQGFEALLRLLQTHHGEFQIEPGPPGKDANIGTIEEKDPLPQALRALAQWDELLQQLPSPNQQLQVDFQRVQDHFEDLTDLSHQLLWQLASHRSIGVLLNDLENNSVTALQELTRLYRHQFFVEVTPTSSHNTYNNPTGPTPTHNPTGGAHAVAQNPPPTMPNEFDNLLAAAAQEAAAHLMAAIQPLDDPNAIAEYDKRPSYFDLPSFQFQANTPPSVPPAPPTAPDDPFSNINPDHIPALIEKLRTQTPTPQRGPSKSPFAAKPPAVEIQNQSSTGRRSDRSTRPELETFGSPAAIDSLLPPEDHSPPRKMTEPLDLGRWEAPSILPKEERPPVVEIQLPENAPATLPDVVAATEADLEDLPTQEDEILILPPKGASAPEDPAEINDSIQALLEQESNRAFDDLLRSTDFTTLPLVDDVETETTEVSDENEPLLLLPKKQTQQPVRSSPFAIPERRGKGKDDKDKDERPLRVSVQIEGLDNHSPSETLPYGEVRKKSARTITGSAASFPLDDRSAFSIEEAKDQLEDEEFTAISLNHHDDEIEFSRPIAAPSPTPTPSRTHPPKLDLNDDFFIEEEHRGPSNQWLWLVAAIILPVSAFAGWYWRQISNNPPAKQLVRTTPTPRQGQPIAQPKPPKRAQWLPNEPTTASADAGAPTTANPDADATTANPDAGAPAPDQSPVAKAPPAKQPPQPVRPRVQPIRPRVRTPRTRRPRAIARRTTRRRPPRTRRRKLSSASVRRLLRRAQRLQRRERFREAEKVLRRALGIRPRLVPLLVQLGVVLYEQNKSGQALRYLETAYRLGPKKTGNGLVTLGSIYYEKNKLDKARRVYKQYLKFYPRGKHVRDVRSMLKNITLNN